MIPPTIALDSENPSVQYGKPPAVPCRISQTAPHETDSRGYLDRQINLFRQSELPGKEHAEKYLSHLHRKNCRSGTIESNQISIKFFLKFIGDQQGIVHLEQVTGRTIEAFVEHEQDRGLKAKTVCVRLMSVHAFLRFLVEGEVINPNILKKKISENVFAGIHEYPPKVPGRVPPVEIQIENEKLCQRTIKIT